MNTPLIALIDDEPQITKALERLLNKSYTLHIFNDPEKFLEIIGSPSPPEYWVIICDQKMPKINGTEVLKQSLKTQENSIRILLTGFSDLELVIGAVNEGHIYRYIHKPWDPVDLRATIEEAVKKFDLNQQLHIQNKKLKELDKAKSHFMHVINHELKTPLTSIMGYLDLAYSETQNNSELQGYLNSIRGNAERLQKLINDVLIITSVQTSQIKWTNQKMLLKNLSISLNPYFENLIKSKQLNIDNQLLNSELSWLADPHWLSQIVRRLIENAIRFANPQSTVTLEAKVEGHHTGIIKISNKGPQIAPEHLPFLGQPFYIAQNFMNHSNATGLGLSVCQALLSLNQSHLKIENSAREGGGVDVYFELKYLS